MADFEIAYKKLQVWEGGKVDHPKDPGGRTNAGITQRSYDAWTKVWNKPQKDVWTATPEEIKAFFLTEYWIPCRGKLIASQPLADFLFSMAVLQGKRAAVRRLQILLGVPTDGLMGAKTLAAINSASSALLPCYAQACLDFFRKLVERRPDSAVFLRGWESRVRAYSEGAV